MPRYKLTIAYEGTNFCGWQKQFPHVDAQPGAGTRFLPGDPPDIFSPLIEGVLGSDSEQEVLAEDAAVSEPRVVRPRMELRTVQGVVERAVRFVTRQPIDVVGASRTDAGVHAKGQVCAFSTLEMQPNRTGVAPDENVQKESGGRVKAESTAGMTNFQRYGAGWPIERGCPALVRAVNARLPMDVLVRAAEIVPENFEPISQAVSKSYSYTIFNSRQRPLWSRNTMLHVWHELDPRVMHEAAQMLVGEHDFAAFATAGHNRSTTVREVFSCSVMARLIEAPLAKQGEVGGQVITLNISGSGFLWNMVRIIAGTLVEVGKGKMTIEDVKRALIEKKREFAGPTLPPEGLCLEEIRYS